MTHRGATAGLLFLLSASLAGCGALFSLNDLSEGGDGGTSAVEGEDGSGDTLDEAAYRSDGTGMTDETSVQDTISPPHDANHPEHDSASDAASEAAPEAAPEAAAPEAAPDAAREASPEAAPVDGGTDAALGYVATVLADMPLAYLRVDESTGTVANDSTGNGNNGQYIGGVTLGVPGALLTDSDTAVSLDGSTGYIDLGNVLPFDGTAPMTLEIWANPTALTTNYPALFSRQTEPPRSGYFMFVREVGNGDLNTFGFERWSNGGYQTAWWQTPVTSSWHHFVATFDGSTASAYVDGQLVASNGAAQSLPSFSASLQVGTCVFNTLDALAGPVDEIAIYGTALTWGRIQAHYHASGR